ncbi:hypothetical protein [Caulobacter mirabilis]|uniref:hypothetical protein n=1 Tax=Caulobacter mirabilis TaxID=69666 RepID=UPI001FE64F5F|nr:hypothetical protein [Caulobacter mirabilis]
MGNSTSNVSIRASQPQSLNCWSTHSALARLCGDPTWFGPAARSFSQSLISLVEISASKRVSRGAAVCAAARPMPPAPSANALAPTSTLRRDGLVLPPVSSSWSLLFMLPSDPPPARENAEASET